MPLCGVDFTPPFTDDPTDQWHFAARGTPSSRGISPAAFWRPSLLPVHRNTHDLQQYDEHFATYLTHLINSAKLTREYTVQSFAATMTATCDASTSF